MFTLTDFPAQQTRHFYSNQSEVFQYISENLLLFNFFRKPAHSVFYLLESVRINPTSSVILYELGLSYVDV